MEKIRQYNDSQFWQFGGIPITLRSSRFVTRCANYFYVTAKSKLVSGIIDRNISILPALRASSYTRTRICILFGYNVCASRIHTIDRGWIREKERERKKKEVEKRRGNDGGRAEKRDGERQEIQGIRPGRKKFSSLRFIFHLLFFENAMFRKILKRRTLAMGLFISRRSTSK